MNNATFRASQPRKIRAAYRPLADDETTAYLNGADLGHVATGAYLRMCVQGAENATDGLYLIFTD